MTPAGWLGVALAAAGAGVLAVRSLADRRRERRERQEWLKHADGPLTDRAWDDRRGQ